MKWPVLPALLAATPVLAAPLTLHPGLTMTTSVYGGMDNAGHLLGDYETVNTVTQVGAGGYAYGYSYRFIVGDKSHGLAPNAGTQSVFVEDDRHATLMRAFWPGRRSIATSSRPSV